MEVIWRAFALACLAIVCVKCQAAAKEKDNKLIGKPFSVVTECAAGESCVRFCCKNESSCEDLNFFDLNGLEEAKNLDINYKILKGYPPCAESDELLHHDSEWKFSKNGTIEYEYFNVSYIETHDTYCLENNGTDVLLVCFRSESEDLEVEAPVAVKQYYPFLMLFSVPFFMATFLVYLCIPDLRNLHGKCLLCYLFGLTCLFLTFPLIQLNHDSILQTRWLCEATGYAAYLSILVCFFFLNVMCYDIYSTFSGIQNSLSVRRAFGVKGGDNRRFLNYCLYAFGLPILISGSVFTTDHLTSIPDDWKIKMAHGRCWIKKEWQIEFIYVYFPMACLLLINLGFYSITAYKIFQVQKQTSSVMEGESHRSSRINLEKTRFFLYLRLFVIMGVPWSIDIASWAMGDSPFLHAADILNCLQGVIIFVLFVWKPKIRKLIFRRLSTVPMTSSGSLSSRKFSKTEMSNFLRRKDSASQGPTSRETSLTINNNFIPNGTIKEELISV